MALLVPPLVQIYFHDIGQSIVMLWTFIRGFFMLKSTKATSLTVNSGCQECQQYCGPQGRTSTRLPLASHNSVTLDLEAGNRVEAGDLYLGNCDSSLRNVQTCGGEPNFCTESQFYRGKQDSGVQSTPPLGHDNSEDLESTPSTPLSNGNDPNIIIVRPGVFCSSPVSIQSGFSTLAYECALKDCHNTVKYPDAFDNEIDGEGFYDTAGAPLDEFYSDSLFTGSLGALSLARKLSPRIRYRQNEATYGGFFADTQDYDNSKPHAGAIRLDPLIVPEGDKENSVMQPMNSLSASYIYAM